MWFGKLRLSTWSAFDFAVPDAGKAITEKVRQRKALKAEFAALSPLELRKRRDLRHQIDALTEDIAVLRASRMKIMEELNKKDAESMSEVKADVEATRARLEGYHASDADLVAHVNKSRARFAELKKQATEFDRDELTDARLALRPQMEDAAHDRIKRSIKSGKVSFWNYQGSITDTDELLGEAGMAERRWEQAQMRRIEQGYERSRKPKRKLGTHEQNR